MARQPAVPPREVTPEAAYLRRREFLQGSIEAGVGLVGLGAGLLALEGRGEARPPVAEPPPLPVASRGAFGADEPPTPYEAVTTHANFYEFGTGKRDPARHASSLRLRPWTVRLDGEVARPRTLDVDDLVRSFPLEERVYRMRCVETWSLVVPWLGFPLGEVLRQAEPTSRARFVAFTTLHDPEQMPGQRRPVLAWPYREGLRLDEALHPLTLLVVGLYGKALPAPNGAPLRLVVPWKYGFKSVKSVVGIRLTAEMPRTSWNQAAPDEYGFYANVNPAVPHPRWSQATERRVGVDGRRPTRPFNGYAEQVAGLYAGMDLRRFY